MEIKYNSAEVFGVAQQEMARLGWEYIAKNMEECGLLVESDDVRKELINSACLMIVNTYMSMDKKVCPMRISKSITESIKVRMESEGK